MSINRVILTGRLVREVEFKTLPSGTGVINNAIAVSHWRKDNSGQSQEHTSFIEVSFFGRTAEIVNQYLRKGSLVGVDGRLEQQSWTDAQTGQNRSKLVVIVEQMQMLESKGTQQDSDDYNGGMPQQPSYPSAQPPYGGGMSQQPRAPQQPHNQNAHPTYGNANQGQPNQQIEHGAPAMGNLPF